MRKTFLMLLLGALLFGCHSTEVQPPNPPPSVEDCLKSVRARYEALKDRADPALERQMNSELVQCMATELSAAQATCVGAVYADYAELARQLVQGGITPAQWLQRTRDRSSKLDRFLRDPVWSEQEAAGDADLDMVPDAQDRCPDTPRWSATDEAGCPLAEPAMTEGPSPEDVRKFFETYVLLPNRRCEGAPPPTVPKVLEATSVDWPSGSRPRIRLELEEGSNQPLGCPVVYECILEEDVPLRLDDPGQPHRPAERLRMVFNPANGRRVSANAAAVVFEKEHARMTFFFHQGCRLKLRAINGNGSTSPWTQKVRVGRR